MNLAIVAIARLGSLGRFGGAGLEARARPRAGFERLPKGERAEPCEICERCERFDRQAWGRVYDGSYPGDAW